MLVPAELPTASRLPPGVGPQTHSPDDAFSAHGAAWLLPHPKQSRSSLLGHRGLSQLLSVREMLPNGPCAQLVPREQDPAALWPARGAELCPGPTTTLLCPEHLRPSSHLGPWGGKRTGHIPSGAMPVISPNLALASSCPRKKYSYNPRSPEAPAASSLCSSLAKDEPLCKLPAPGTNPGCRCCAQAVRASAEPMALWDPRQRRWAAWGKTRANHGPEAGREQGVRGCRAPWLAPVPRSQPRSPTKPFCKDRVSLPWFYSSFLLLQ